MRSRSKAWKKKDEEIIDLCVDFEYKSRDKEKKKQEKAGASEVGGSSKAEDVQTRAELKETFTKWANKGSFDLDPNAMCYLIVDVRARPQQPRVSHSSPQILPADSSHTNPSNSTDNRSGERQEEDGRSRGV